MHPHAKRGDEEKYMFGQTNGGVFNPKNLGLFTYTYNNPVNLVDPDGMAPKDLKQFVPRSKWSNLPAEPSKMTKSTGSYNKITLHHTGSATTPQGVEKIHRGKEGFIKSSFRKAGSLLGLSQTYEGYGDVGYNFMIGKDGEIFEGRDMKFDGAHVKGANKDNIGIAFLGDYTNDQLSDSQIGSLTDLIGELDKENSFTSSSDEFIFTHGDFNAKKHDELKGGMQQLDKVENFFMKKTDNE